MRGKEEGKGVGVGGVRYSMKDIDISIKIKAVCIQRLILT